MSTMKKPTESPEFPLYLILSPTLNAGSKDALFSSFIFLFFLYK